MSVSHSVSSDKYARALHAEDVNKLFNIGFKGCSQEEYETLPDEDKQYYNTIMVHWDDLPEFTRQHYKDKAIGN